MSDHNYLADTTTGVVFIHAAPTALCPHVEWALAATLDANSAMRWEDQPAQPGARKAIVDWIGPVGTGARLADSLAKWAMLSFEVTEDPSDLVDGERFSHTPELGMWRGQTGASGDVVISENRLRHLMKAGPAAFHSAVEDELGTAWDRALEPLRGHPAAAEVTWLSRVG
ncbi:DUF3145 domain-containing protein [Dietzia sp. B32]|uniref:DUF3145 domain-containing protein n=1 Tax=Dietzia sp. B32 TaxID=2915130 RepID=UPI0021ADA2EC|nr:DUF3145 domain-containing protein [Dietzia sp. B32]UVE95204.1 DUF3145 domain-containing protein [Dietzia sp. B32]